MEELIMQYTVIPVFLICLCIGYCIKHISALDVIANEYIPLIVCVIGAALACWMTGTIDVDTIAKGMVSGLASTGFHQLVDQLIEKYAARTTTDFRDDIEMKVGDVDDKEEN